MIVPDTNFAVQDDLLRNIRTRSNRREESRFPYKLWKLLQYSRAHPESSCGCGWVDDVEFFLDKEKLCEILKIKMNTLNVNLKTLNFKLRRREGRRTFWSHDGFERQLVGNQSFERLRNIRGEAESVKTLSLIGAYMPLLESLRIYGLSEHEANRVKVQVVHKWLEITDNGFIFAMSLKKFKQRLMEISSGTVTDVDKLLQECLGLSCEGVMNVVDFGLLMARFGPFEALFQKSEAYVQGVKAIKGETCVGPYCECFSKTFDNGFCFTTHMRGEYHFYNIPTEMADGRFLIDEDHNSFGSWAELRMKNACLDVLKQL